MKAGDLIRPKGKWIEGIGIIIETGQWAGNRDIKVFWDDGAIFILQSKQHEVINDT